jgi:hypothetical protein
LLDGFAGVVDLLVAERAFGFLLKLEPDFHSGLGRRLVAVRRRARYAAVGGGGGFGGLGGGCFGGLGGTMGRPIPGYGRPAAA